MQRNNIGQYNSSVKCPTSKYRPPGRVSTATSGRQLTNRRVGGAGAGRRTCRRWPVSRTRRGIVAATVTDEPGRLRGTAPDYGGGVFTDVGPIGRHQ
ncbi:hypothetical protein EVAR_19746_1 [Eumeta japonica]|uniref:Uncharacterized protein n=1 Tax=Eumeta variegata TaxID=151549 RepID=A0A4C1UQJ1_EUMVA|nr:hypothetical protein EVAR_19746_1 [Eumeta japonica]